MLEIPLYPFLAKKKIVDECLFSNGFDQSTNDHTRVSCITNQSSLKSHDSNLPLCHCFLRFDIKIITASNGSVGFGTEMSATSGEGKDEDEARASHEDKNATTIKTNSNNNNSKASKKKATDENIASKSADDDTERLSGSTSNNNDNEDTAHDNEEEQAAITNDGWLDILGSGAILKKVCMSVCLCVCVSVSVSVCKCRPMYVYVCLCVFGLCMIVHHSCFDGCVHVLLMNC
jgi:hypothetical protein